MDQKAGLEAQLRDLEAEGCERVFTEQVSSVDMKAREKLEEAMSFIRKDDHLVVTKLDRLARSMAHLMDIRQRLDERGAFLKIIGLNLDTSTPTGKLMLNLLGSVAEFEREIMLERQREGIAKAKAAGKYKGRKPTARARSQEVLRLHKDGVGASEIARTVNIGRASVYRILND